VRAETVPAGAKFVVELPMIAAIVDAAVPESSPSQPPGHRLSGMRVLVVEDHDDTRELIITVLEEHGARVEAAAFASVAFAKFREAPPDLLVADIGLPGEDGYMLMERIRALPAADGGTVPAVALTAYAQLDDRTRALAAGFTAHLPKPVERVQLIACVVAQCAAQRA
jgi:CheY-like chemotaxis protein